MKQEIESANHGSLKCESLHRLEKFHALPYFKDDGSINTVNRAAHVSLKMITKFGTETIK
jgi:hypothetical protein